MRTDCGDYGRPLHESFMWWHPTQSLANLLIAAYCSDMLLQVLVVCYISKLMDESVCIAEFSEA